MQFIGCRYILQIYAHAPPPAVLGILTQIAVSLLSVAQSTDCEAGIVCLTAPDIPFVRHRIILIMDNPQKIPVVG